MAFSAAGMMEVSTCEVLVTLGRLRGKANSWGCSTLKGLLAARSSALKRMPPSMHHAGHAIGDQVLLGAPFATVS